MDIGRCNGCGEIMSGDDLEWTENTSADMWGNAYQICPFCGSDRIEDVVAKADFLRDQMKEGI